MRRNKALVNSDVKRGSWSVITSAGRPTHAKTPLSSLLAVVGASSKVVAGTKKTKCVNLSTATQILSKPSDLGRPIRASICKVWKGSGTVFTAYIGEYLRVSDFPRKHTVHEPTFLLTQPASPDAHTE